jgi:hypothetical protein
MKRDRELQRGRNLSFPLRLDGATAAALLDLCGQLSHALLREWGDEIEAHWTDTDPDQLIYGPLLPPTRKL